jgi:hypothetical protein
MARVPSALRAAGSAPPAAASLEAAAAAKRTARVADLRAQLERFDNLLKSSLALPDGGANVRTACAAAAAVATACGLTRPVRPAALQLRAKRDALAAELETLRASAESAPAPQELQASKSQPAAASAGEAELLATLGALAL